MRALTNEPYPQLAGSAVWFFFNGWKRLVDTNNVRWNHQKVFMRAVYSAARLDYWEGMIERHKQNNADEVLPSPRGITSGGSLGDLSKGNKT